VGEIELLEVSKEYGDGHEAVKDLSLRIHDGEFMILVGPSGCGKSTALRMIAGLEDATSGQLRIGGEVVNDLPPKDRDVAMVFQNYALYPHMTVRENMGFALRLAKLDRAERERRVEEAAEVLDLTEHLDRKPGQLSGGQRQRVAMGRAIVRNPKAFLLDEPLSNLDAKLRVQMRTQIALLQQRLGTTTVHVTHDQTEAMTLGDRVAVMRAGRLQQVGTPLELYDEPANLFVASFIGSPPMSFVPALVDDDRVRLPFADLDAARVLNGSGPIASTPRTLVAGIRPEAFEDAALVADESATGVVFEARVEVLEALGSDLFAHLRVGGGDPELTRCRDELAGRAAAAEALNGHSGERITARLDIASEVAEGGSARFWLDPAKIQLFDPGSGVRIG
jgi:multiple sugar transport system ATP-binding protein